MSFKKRELILDFQEDTGRSRLAFGMDARQRPGDREGHIERRDGGAIDEDQSQRQGAAQADEQFASAGTPSSAGDASSAQ